MFFPLKQFSWAMGRVGAVVVSTISSVSIWLGALNWGEGGGIRDEKGESG